MEVQELSKEFIGKGEVKGKNFRQVEASDIGYIYEVTDGEDVYYEIFERRLTPVCIDFKNRIYSDSEYKVRFPKSKDFGDWAYTTSDFNRAGEILKGFWKKKCLDSISKMGK